MTAIATPSPALETIEGKPINLQDGRTRFYRKVAKAQWRASSAAWTLGRELTVQADRKERTGDDRHEIIPAGAVIRLVAIETLYLEDEESSYETRIVEGDRRLLFEVVSPPAAA